MKRNTEQTENGGTDGKKSRGISLNNFRLFSHFPFVPCSLFPWLMIILLAAGAAPAPGHKPALHPNPPLIHSRQATVRGEGKPPVIFIPGILGSRLVNRRTGETVWPELKDGAAGLALPISAPVLAENKDEIVATEVLEEAAVNPLIPPVSVYGPLFKALERNGGYRRGNFIAPPPAGASDTFYVFAYDWRRDIVESARALGNKIEDLKRRLGRPDLRFDIVAHSMGGLVARYYAMYGDRDVLDHQDALPDWSGARNLGKIVMIGAPNTGSMSALRVLLRGYSAGDAARPSGGFLHNVRRELLGARIGPGVVFTVPAVYQLLPPRRRARFFGADLKPLPVELYEAETWRRYKWSAAFDERIRQREWERLIKDLGPAAGRAESLRRSAERERFLRIALRRAAAFHNALVAESPPPANLRFIFIGGDCIATLDGAVILTGAAPRTIFKPSDFTGEKWLKRRTVKLIFNLGDGTVTRHSLLGHPLNVNPAEPVPTAMRSTPVRMAFFCKSHCGLIADPAANNDLLMALLVR
ncbi:MAG: esterase/lipase family protein [Blastocatellia bacterium]